MSTVTLSGSGTLTSTIVNSQLGSATTVIISGYDTIGSFAFYQKTQITSVTIPSSVTNIQTSAFRETGLTSVFIPSSVTIMGSDVFAYTQNLTNIDVDINNPNLSSQDGVLFNKTKTTLLKYPTWNSRLTYTIPSTVTNISTRSFGVIQYSWNKLENVVLNEGLLTIQDFAFRACIFSTINIPSSVTSVASLTFYSMITASINVDSSNPNYSSQDGVLFNKNKTIILNYSHGNTQTSYTIPSTVTIIREYSFTMLSLIPLVYQNLQTVIISNSVTTIGFHAFAFINSLKSVTIGNSVSTIGSEAFDNCFNLTSVTFLGLIPTIGINNFLSTLDTVFYNPDLNAGNPNLAPMLALFTINVPICFPAGTPVVTDQGQMPIEKINPSKNTIRGKKIVAITKTVTLEDKIVCIEKDALGTNIPSQKTCISRNHKLFYNKQMIKAKHLIGQVDGVYNKKYNGETLYNVLLETHEKMMVNNLIVETLDPKNVVAQLYNGNLSETEKINAIVTINKAANEYKKAYGKLK